MRLIEKIEITYFRSFKKTEIYELKDLNIFSGANDSGKSNILRALNLFFNNEIAPGIPLDIERDFNILKEEEIKNQTKGKKSIDINVHFISKSVTTLRDNRFSIKKRWNFEGIHSTTVFKDKNWNAEIYNIYREPNIYTKKNTKDDASQRSKSINRFLNTVFFFYVPAIKDERFFSHIFGKLLSTIKENEELLESKKISDNINGLESSINNETQLILDQFAGIGMKFNVPKNLETFFSAFDIGTTDLNSQLSSSITIKSRGDGVQAKLIPYLLELLEINQNKKSKNKNIFIWGFEEPENSFEYRNANELAINFKNNYSIDKNRQIFITTHSFNFLSLEGENISTYRIFRGEDNISELVGPIGTSRVKRQTSLLKDENLLKLEDELGFFTLNKDLENLYLEKEEERKLLELKRIEFEEKTKEALVESKTIVYCENRNADELSNINFPGYIFLSSNSKIFAFDAGKDKAGPVFSLIDRDYLTEREVNWIEKNTNVRILDYYCFENYLYHPENLKEYYDNLEGVHSFSITEYYEGITQEFSENKLAIISNISSARQSYKHITSFINKTEVQYNVKDFDGLLNEDVSFDELYRCYSMKDNCKSLKERQNIPKSELTKTNWFTEKIKSHLLST